MDLHVLINKPNPKVTIIHLGTALIHLVNESQLILKSGPQYVNLTKIFPLLKSGYCCIETMDLFMLIYLKMRNIIHTEGQIDFVFDDLFNETFNNDISASYEYLKIPPNTNYIKQMNTIQVLQTEYLNFDPQHFQTPFLKDLIKLNSYNCERSVEYQQILNDSKFVQNLTDEYNIMKELHIVNVNHRIFGPPYINIINGNINDFILFILKLRRTYDPFVKKVLVEQLINYKLINPLHYAIIKNKLTLSMSKIYGSLNDVNIIIDHSVIQKYLRVYDP